jgi:hypothetical protein
MSVENAVKLFTSIPKTHNCAQAVAEGCGHANLLPELAAAGGGKAPGGMCGALYAALLITDSEAGEKIQKAFEEAAGAVTCREIKVVTGFPCVECVRKAAELAEKFKAVK